MAAAELTVNYRTPARSWRLAVPVLAAIGAELQAPTSMRESGLRPGLCVRRFTSRDLSATVAAAVAAEAADLTSGQLAVLHQGGLGRRGPTSCSPPSAPWSRTPRTSAGPGRRVVVLEVHEAKGLEFDRVIVVEPAAIVDAPAMASVTCMSR